MINQSNAIPEQTLPGASKKKKALYYVLPAIIALSIGLYFRLYPLFFYTNADSSEKATLLVLAQLKKSVTQEISLNYPDLPLYQKNSVIKKQFDELLRKDSTQVRKTIDRLAQEIDAESFPQKTPYLLESDAYNYYNLTENITRTGKISDEIKGSKYFNKLMMAPIGYYEPLNLHPYVGYFVYKVSQVFDPNVSLMFALGFTSLLITVLALIAFTLMCYRLKCSAVTTFVSSIFFILAPIFIKRSCFGWYDADPYTIFFPLIILFFLFSGLENQSPPKRILFAILTAIFILLYALFWQGWVYLFCVVMCAGIAIILYNHFVLKNSKNTQNILIYFGTIFFTTFISIAVAFGIKDFFVLFQEGWRALKEFLFPSLSLWPDMYVSVGELRKATIAEISEFTGGFFFLGIVAVGLISYTIQSFRKPSTFYDPFKIIVISIFFVSSLFLTFGAQRFALLCLIPLSILFAFGIQFCADCLHIIFQKIKIFPKDKPQYGYLFISVILLSSIAIPILHAKSTTLSLLNRIFNETWEKVLTKIDQETPENSIVNTWWPPGHFIKSIAHRKVTFDGATINKPQAYWMANVFLSSDETKALGMLRMLNSSSNLAIEYIQSLKITGLRISNRRAGTGSEPSPNRINSSSITNAELSNLSTTIDLLKEITSSNKEDARKKLTGILQEKEINHLLDLTHGTPPPSYLLIYNELVEKNLVLSFVNRWNFRKVEEINRTPQLKKLIPGKQSPGYIKFLWEIAGGALNCSETIPQLGNQNNTVYFEHNIQIDLEKMECLINSEKFGRGIPKSIIFLYNDQVIEKKLSGGRLPYSVVLLKEGDRYNCMLMDQRLANSILVKLYFFNGQGLKYFNPFTKESDLTKRTQICVFEVRWKDFLKDIGED